MRRLRYCVAMSLDGFIAGANGEYDWIVQDPAVNFPAIWAQFDTLLMGRRTYEVAAAMRDWYSGSASRWIVVSSTMNAGENPGIEILKSDICERVAALKSESGKDIWLFGGGTLFRSMLDAGLVDAVEVSVSPVMLGSGVPLLPEGARQSLRLEESRVLPSGIVMLTYSLTARANSSAR